MAPSTPPSSPDIRVRAVIALPPLELSEKYSLDDDVVTTVPGLIRRVSEQFDQALFLDEPFLDEPFDYEDFEFFPALNPGEEPKTFRQALPPGQHTIATIITPSPGHGNILKRLMERLEVEKKQQKLIMEEALETAGSGGSKSTKPKRKNRNSKAALPPTPPQAVDFGAELDRRISALEQDNVELKRDNVELKRDNVELKRGNVALKSTVDRHWASITALSRRSLLDSARLKIMSECDLSWSSLRVTFRQNHSEAAVAIYELLPQDFKDALSVQSVKTIFGRESAASRHGAEFQTVRERGNTAAHKLNPDDVVSAVLQVDLTKGERSALDQIYTFVFGQPPSFEASM